MPQFILSDIEERKVQVNRRAIVNRPKFFNAQSEKFQVISEDFETFLILAESSSLNIAKDWLSKVVSLNSKNKDRDQLVAESIFLDKQDAIQKSFEAGVWIDEFTEFKNKFNSQRFNEVSEVGLIIRDLEIFIGEHLLNIDRYTHLDILADVLQVRHGLNQTTENLQKQLESWAEPLTAYVKT